MTYHMRLKWGVGASPFGPDPTSVSGLLVWMDAGSSIFKDAGVTPPANGETVYQWNDRSSNAYILNQTSAPNRLKYKTGDGTGYPCVTASAGIEFARSTANISNTIGTGDFIMCAAVRIVSVANAYRAIATWDATSNGLYESNVGSTHFASYFGGQRFFDTVLREGSVYILTLVNASGVLKGYVNGVLESTTISSTFTTPVDKFVIGAESSGGEGAGPKIFETVLYQATPSSGNLANIHNYFLNKYILAGGDIDESSSSSSNSSSSSSSSSSGITDPSNISGLLTWFKADTGVYKDLGSTAAADTELVEQWNDQSGNAYNAVQAVSGQRPKFIANEFGGHPAVQGISNFGGLVTPSVTAGIGTGDFIISFVVKPVTIDTVQRNLMSLIVTGPTLDSTAGGGSAAVGSYVGGAIVWPTTLTTNTLYLLDLVRSAGNVSLYVNGALISTVSAGASITNAAMYLCGDPGKNTIMDSKIFEMVMFAASPSTNNMAHLRSYFNSKYAIY